MEIDGGQTANKCSFSGSATNVLPTQMFYEKVQKSWNRVLQNVFFYSNIKIFSYRVVRFQRAAHLSNFNSKRGIQIAWLQIFVKAKKPWRQLNRNACRMLVVVEIIKR